MKITGLTAPVLSGLLAEQTTSPRLSARPAVAKYSHAYVEGLIITLLFCWSPSNALGYAAPWAMLGWFLLRTRSKTVLRRLGGCLIVWAVLVLGHAPFIQDFAWSSAGLAWFTYAAFIPIVAIPSRFLVGDILLKRTRRIVVILIVVEAGLGLVQALYGYSRSGSFDIANGDHVEGTIHPWLAPELSFSNPMFAVNMTFLLLALLPYFLVRRQYKIVFGLGVLVLLLASVLHVLLFLGAAIVITFILYGTVLLNRTAGCLLALVLAAGVLLSTTLLSTNLSALGGFVQATVARQTPRGILIDTILTEMPKEYPLMPLFGLGPGQFTSRAGLIGTGRYFGGPRNPQSLPLIQEQMSQPFADYFMDLWLRTASVSYYGSTHQPFSSWLSVYTELGLVTWGIILAGLGWFLIRVRQRSRGFANRALAIALTVGSLFLLLLGWQENYWEVPQAIFPGLLILKMFHASIRLERTLLPE